MAFRLIRNRALIVPTKFAFGAIPRAALFYSTSPKPASSSQSPASEAETHFGFQTVKESLKAGKGKCFLSTKAIYLKSERNNSIRINVDILSYTDSC